MTQAAYATRWRQPSWRHILERLRLADAPASRQVQVEVIDLEDRGCYVLRDALGTRMHCEAGHVWITQHRDPVDVTLHSGEHFCIDRSGETVAFAVGPCRLRIER